MGWQPIDTAPKDGRRVLVLDGEHISIAGRKDDGIYWCVAHDWLAHNVHGKPVHVVPTHWMPAPEPLK